MTFRKKGKILLALIAILLTVSILDLSINKEAVFEAFGEQFMDEQKTGAFYDAQQAVEKTAQRQIEIGQQNIKEVFLPGTGGKISVERASGQSIILEYTVKAAASNAEQADRRLEAVKVQETVSDGLLTLATTEDGKSIDHDYISMVYVLRVPDGIKLRLESDRGSVHVHGIKGDLVVESKRGLMEIVNVQGNVSINSSYETLYLSDIKGNIHLKNQYGEADVHAADGNIVLDSQGGENFMTNIAGGITAHTRSGFVHLREVAGPVEVKGRGTDIQLDHIQNHIQVVSESGDTRIILLESKGYTLDATANRDTIQTYLPFPIEKDKESENGVHMSGVIGDGAWKVDVDVSSAKLIIQ